MSLYILGTVISTSTLQGAYLIIAARVLGLDCGPMSGFGNAKVDEEFFGAGVDREGMCEEYVPGSIKSNFLCNIGYGDPASRARRAPRLDFTEVCRMLQVMCNYVSIPRQSRRL
jgi:3-hydroxypropanoate dehydrogenase